MTDTAATDDDGMDIRPPANIDDERAARWLHQRYRGYRDVLIGTAVLCVGCGRMLGVTTVVIPPDYDPPDPDWPFGQEWCPVCGGTEPERIEREDVERRLEEQRATQAARPEKTAMMEPATAATECEAMIVIRPERQGGVIFRCTRQAGHASEHTTGGMAEEYPLVENTADLPFLVRWKS